MFKTYVFMVATALIVLAEITIAAEIGTRENPVPIGTTVELSDGWQITVLNVIPNATDTILNESKFNEPPEQGHQFFMATLEAKNNGSDTDFFDAGSRLQAVGPSSTTYSNFATDLGTIPNPLPESTLVPGESVTGNIAWNINSSDADTLVMYDKPLYGSKASPIFMALYS